MYLIHGLFVRWKSSFNHIQLVKTRKLPNLQIHASLQHRENCTKVNSRSGPCNIAVTAGGDLVYNYYNDRSVNIVKSSRVHTKVRFDFWRISTYIYILSALYNNKWLQGWGIRGIVRTRYCFSNSVCHCKLIFVFLDW